MKTTKDIADFLKRNGRVELSYDDKANVFRVVSGSYLKSHRYLDEALELVAEERRRADSGTTLRGSSSAVSVLCPTCSSRPFTFDHATVDVLVCKFQHKWAAPVGVPVSFFGFATSHVYDGERWKTVDP